MKGYHSRHRNWIWLWVILPPIVLGGGTLAVVSYFSDAPRSAKREGPDQSARPSLQALRTAVRLHPTDRDLKLQLGIALTNANQDVAAENMLREAMKGIPASAQLYKAGLHYLLPVMIRRGETKQLLSEFPSPPAGAHDNAAADILFARSSAFQISGEADKARQAMDDVLAFRHDAEALVRSATLASQQDDIRLARSNVHEALKAAPNNESALGLTVALDYRFGDAKQALADANEYLRRLPHSANARAMRIDALLAVNDDAEARRELGVLAKESSRSIEVPLFRSILMARSKDFGGAWAQIQFLPPDFLASRAPVVITVASIAVASGHLRTGINLLGRFVAHNPDDRLVPLQLAAALLRDNSPQEALDTLKPFGAHNLAAAALRAQAYLSLRQFGDAFHALDQIVSLPKHSDLTISPLAVDRMAFSGVELAENERIVRGLQTLRDRIPADSNTAGPLVAALIKAARWNEALAAAQQLAVQLPDSPLPPFYRGQVLFAHGKLAEAEAAFGRALSLDPALVPALYYRANILAMRGAFAAANADLEALRGRAGLPATLRMAEIAEDRGADQEALALLANGMAEVVPPNIAPRLALATYHMGRGHYKEAQAAVTAMLRIAPYNPEVQALKGQIELLQGDRSTAISTFRSLTTITNPPLPGAFALLSRALYSARDLPAAEQAARTALQWAPDSTQLHLQLIEIQLAGEKTEAALETARAYAKTYPGPEADLLEAELLLRVKRQAEGEAVLRRSIGAQHGVRNIEELWQIATDLGYFTKASALLSDWAATSPKDAVAGTGGVQKE